MSLEPKKVTYVGQMVLGSQFRVTELESPNFVYMQRNKKLGLRVRFDISTKF